MHRVAFSAAEVALQADGRGGLYDLALLVGDAAVASPIEWRLGQVHRPAVLGSRRSAGGWCTGTIVREWELLRC